MVDPDHIKSKLISNRFFQNGDPLAGGAEFLPNNRKMEIMLGDIRKCIGRNGEEMFCKFVAIFQSHRRYNVLGEKLLGKQFKHLNFDYRVYHSYQYLTQVLSHCYHWWISDDR